VQYKKRSENFLDARLCARLCRQKEMKKKMTKDICLKSTGKV
jgi:hypothetical protein